MKEPSIMSETLDQIDTDDSFLMPGQEQGAGQPSDRQDDEPNGDAASREEPKPKQVEPKPDTTPDYIKRRIGKSVAAQRQAERERDEALARAENLEKALRYSRGEQEQEPREQTPDEIRANERQRIEKASAQERSANEFNQTCNSLAEKIGAEFGADAVAASTRQLAENVGLNLDNPDHQSVIRDIARLPNAAQVYRALSNDPDAAYRIFEAEDKREGYAELRDFAREIQAEAAGAPSASAPVRPAPVSQAPRPAGRSPAGQRVSSRTIYDEDVSMDEFIAMRGKKR